MNKKVKNGIFCFLIGFTFFFAFRLIYGYTSSKRQFDDEEGLFEANVSMDHEVKRNYASTKMRWEKSVSDNAPRTVSAIEQKYEKIARYTSKTDKFEEDNKKLKGEIVAFKGIVQSENNSGNQGNRIISMSIGIRPDSFDLFCEKVKQIGTIKSVNISKTDKTNEFKKLNAKKASLEKIRNSLVELKNKGGRIDEYISLENRILELESELQDLGVSLGEFDAENEFCTVYFTLSEGKVVKISFLHRAKVAFEWALKYYALFLCVLFLSGLVSLILVVIVEKLKILNLLKS
jgi:hypothetical protein